MVLEGFEEDEMGCESLTESTTTNVYWVGSRTDLRYNAQDWHAAMVLEHPWTN